jgi:hypothetical protein
VKIAGEPLNRPRQNPFVIKMHQTSTDSTNNANIDPEGKHLGSRIISLVMGKYPLQESWTTKNEKVCA